MSQNMDTAIAQANAASQRVGNPFRVVTYTDDPTRELCVLPISDVRRLARQGEVVVVDPRGVA